MRDDTENSERDELRSWQNYGSVLNTLKFEVFLIPPCVDGVRKMDMDLN